MDRKKKLFLLLTFVIIVTVLISIGGMLLVNRDLDTEDASAAVEEDIDVSSTNDQAAPITIFEMKTLQNGRIYLRHPRYVAKGESFTLDFSYAASLPQPTSTPSPKSVQPTPTTYGGYQLTPTPNQNSSIRWKGTICGQDVEGEGWYISFPVVIKTKDCGVTMSVMNGGKDEGSISTVISPYRRVRNYKMNNVIFPKKTSIYTSRFEITKRFAESEIANLPLTNTEDVSLKWTWEALTPACRIIYATHSNSYKEGTAYFTANNKGLCRVSLTVTVFSCEKCQEKNKIAVKSKKIMNVKINESKAVPTHTTLPTPRISTTPTPVINTPKPSVTVSPTIYSTTWTPTPKPTTVILP